MSNLGKILERLMCNRLQEHREVRGLHPNQYGFRPHRSTEDALNRAVEEVHSNEVRKYWGRPSMAVLVLEAQTKEMFCINIRHAPIDMNCAVSCKPRQNTYQRLVRSSGTSWRARYLANWTVTEVYKQQLLIQITLGVKLKYRVADIMMSLAEWCKANKTRIVTYKTQCALMKRNLSPQMLTAPLRITSSLHKSAACIRACGPPSGEMVWRFNRTMEQFL